MDETESNLDDSMSRARDHAPRRRARPPRHRPSRAPRALRGAACLLLASTLAGASPALAGEEASNEQALFARGTAALDAGNPGEALRAFQAIWKRRKPYDVAYHLARAERELGRHCDAAEHLTFALGRFPMSGPPGLRRRIEDLLAEEKSHVATLIVRVDAAAARVTVKGCSSEALPLSGERFAAPGTAILEARAPGYEPAERRLAAKKGERRPVDLRMVRAEPPRERPNVSLVLALGATMAGVLVGSTAGGVAAVRARKLGWLCDAELRCPGSARGLLEDATLAAHVATAGFIAAGAAAVASVGLLLLPRAGAPSHAALSLRPGFVGVTGVF